jgi:hypothetical protein
MVLDPPVQLRAAVAEASAGSMPIHAMHREGSIMAAGDFDGLLTSLDGPRLVEVVPEPDRGPTPGSAVESGPTEVPSTVAEAG